MADWTPALRDTDLWLDANDGDSITHDASGYVSQWNDKSGNTRHVKQATETNKPRTDQRTIDSKNAIDFDGSDNYLDTDNAATWMNGGTYTVFAVLQSDVTTSASRHFIGTPTGSSNQGLHIGWRDADTWTLGQWSNDGDWDSLTRNTNAELYTTKYKDTGGEFWRNGDSQGTTSLPNSDLNTSAVLQIGTGWSSDYWDGLIAEVIVVTGTLSDDERAQIEGYLAHKWGLEGSLPSDHHYKNGAPQTEYTWDGGGADNNFSTEDNWSTNVAPIGGEKLIFAGSTRTSPNNDLPADTEVDGIQFTSASSAFTIGGNKIKLTNKIRNNDDTLQTISLNIELVGTQIVLCDSGDVTLSGIVSGAYGVTKTGTYTLNFAGASDSTFTGTLLINNGLVKLDNTNIGSGALTLSGGDLRISQINLARNITADIAEDLIELEHANGSELSGSLTVNANIYIDVVDTEQEISGYISGASNITVRKYSSGSLLLSYVGDNGHTGEFTLSDTNGGVDVDVSNGNQSRAAFGNCSKVIIENGSQLRGINSDNELFGYSPDSDLQIQINTGGTLTCSSNQTYHCGEIIFNGGTLDATTPNTTHGNWNLDYGVSVTSNDGTIATNANVTNTDNPTNWDIDSGGVLTVNGKIIDASGVTTYNMEKEGSGRLKLVGTNTFEDTLTINGGDVIVNGSLAANCDVTVNSLGTLGGTGTVNGNVTVSGEVEPGEDGIGTLSIGGNLVLNSSANLRYTLGTSSDLLSVTGNLTLDGDLYVTDGAGFTGTVYEIVNYSGSLVDNGLTIQLLPSGYIGSISAGGGDVDLHTSIPVEPHAIASLEAFGSPSLNVDIKPSAITSAEVFGSPTLNLYINVNSIPSSEAFGSPQVNLKIDTITGIPSAEAFGLAYLNSAVHPNGIASDEAFGNAILNLQLNTNSITSVEAFGSPTCGFAFHPSSITSLEAFGLIQEIKYQIRPPSIPSEEHVSPPNSIDLVFNVLSIDSGEAFGSPELGLAIDTPTGITSEEVFGTPTLHLHIVATGITSAEDFGSPELNLTITNPISIVSVESFGSPTLNLQVRPDSIDSDEVFGDLQLDLHIVAHTIDSAEAFGQPQVDMQIRLNGIATEEAFGIPVLVYNQFVVPNSIVSAEAFGSPTLANIVSVHGIPSLEEWGQCTVSVGVVYIQLNGIASAEAFGSLTVSAGIVYITPQGIYSNENFGTPSLGLRVHTPTGISTNEAFGSPSVVPGMTTISLNGISSEEVFGEPTFITTSQVTPIGVNTEEIFGILSVVPGSIQMTPNSVITQEVFGEPGIIASGVTIASGSIHSSEAFGLVSIVPQLVSVHPNGIASAEIFGSSLVTTGNVSISTESIPTAESFGNNSVSPGIVYITPSSISSAEGFGLSNMSVGGVSITPDMIYSNENFGKPRVGYSIDMTPILSGESFGSMNVSTGGVSVNINGIPSEEYFGSHTLRNVLVISSPTGIASSEGFGNHVVFVRSLSTFQQMMEADLEEGFFGNDPEFAEHATFVYDTGESFDILVIFDADYQSVDPETGASVQSLHPMIMCQSSKFTRRPRHGCKMIIRGVNYQVQTYEPDGTGVSTLTLHHEKTV